MDEQRWENLRPTFMELAQSSPFYRHMKIEVENISEEGARVSMSVAAELMNLIGIAHGGAIASVADSACGLALLPHLEAGETAVTQNLDVQYFKPVHAGKIFAEGKLIHRSRQSALLEAVVTNSNGERIGHTYTLHAIRKASDRPDIQHFEGDGEADAT